MHIQLIAVGTRMPAWVEQGFQDYAKRLPRECRLGLAEIPAVKRGKAVAVSQAMEEEGRRLLDAAAKGARVVALDEKGRCHDTQGVARRLERWLLDGRDVALLLGGADGLSQACREAAEETWSLSPLTFPHPLVRVIVAEQLYRAWSLLNNHPYHRAG